MTMTMTKVTITVNYVQNQDDGEGGGDGNLFTILVYSLAHPGRHDEGGWWAKIWTAWSIMIISNSLLTKQKYSVDNPQ